MIKTLAIAAFASTLALAAPVTSAEAGTNLNFDIGLNLGGGGYYDPGYYGPSHGYPVYDSYPVYHGGCGYAREVVRSQGFRKVRALDCDGSRFAFKAKRHGDWWLVTTNRSGSIRSVRPL